MHKYLKALYLWNGIKYVPANLGDLCLFVCESVSVSLSE